MRLILKAFLAIIFVTVAAFVALRWATAPLEWQQSFDDEQCCVDITHAGGLLNGVAYTNSLEALEANYAAGRRIFEIDLIETSDGEIVLGHDWDDFEGEAQTLDIYRGANPDLTLMTFSEFAEWVSTDCVGCRIVTDTKLSFTDFIELYQEVAPKEAQAQSYVLQLYGPEDMALVAAELPSQPTILTTYLLDDFPPDLLAAAAADSNLIAITMPVDRVPTNAASVREATGKPVYTHGPPWLMGSVTALMLGRLFGVTGFYRD